MPTPSRNCTIACALCHCPHCGLPVRVARIDRGHILPEITRVPHFERGILFTVRELLLRSGDNIRTFFAYSAWAIVPCCERKKNRRYALDLPACLPGMVSFYLAAILPGTGIDRMGVG